MYTLGPEFDSATVTPGTNILVAGPPLSGKRRLAFEALSRGVETREGSIIVTTRDSARRVLDTYGSVLASPESNTVGFVDCVTRHQGRSPSDTSLVKYASSPVDMTGIGINFSSFLQEFCTERELRQNRIVFDSLSTLLMYSDLQTVFRFMHVFTSRVDDANAIGLYTIDSTAHDIEAMNTLKQLFDGIVIVEENSDVSIRLPDAA